MLLSESIRAVARRDGDALHRPERQHMDVALPDWWFLASATAVCPASGRAASR